MTKKNTNVWVADYETESVAYYEKFGHTKTWLTYIENLADESENHLDIEISDFYDYIKKQLDKQKVNQFVYFHNVSFDGTFILYYLNEIGARYETVINNMKRIYEIKVFPSKANRYISFRCSYLIFLCAVSSLPYSTKSTIDYERIRNYKSIKDATETEIYYIKQDVKTVARNLRMLNDDFKVKLTGFFKTIGSISYKDLKNTTIKMLRKKNRIWKWYFPNISIDLDEKMRPAYRGGYTYLNPKFKGETINKEVGSWDMVSSYPTRMKYNYLPSGKPFISKKKPPKGKLYIVKIRILKATIKEGLHPFINPSQKLRYLNDIYPETMEQVVISLTNIDFDLFNKYYHSTYDIVDYVIFPKKVKGIFNDYIDKIFKMKNDAKTIMNDPTSTEEQIHRAVFTYFWSKLMFNSPYGKFGTNPHLFSAIPHFNNEGMLEWEEVEEVKEDNAYYLPLACFITAYAREALIDQIQENADRFIYCDTDSIHLLGTSEPESMNGLLGSELGQWEYEGTSYKSRFIKPKQYLKIKKDHEGNFEIKRTIASLNKSEHHRIDFSNFHTDIVIEKGKRVAKNVKGGRIIQPLAFTFK